VGPTVAVTVANAQRIHISAHKYMGSGGGASGLDTTICHQPALGGAVTILNLGMWGGSVPANTRIPWGATAVISGLAAGSYNVGLCARSGVPANWNSNEWGFTSALVFQP
jgi:hypothetical protein